jgi:hypothetical protein
MITSTPSEEEMKLSHKLREPFSVTLGKFLLVKLHELRLKLVQGKKCSTFDKNMLMVVAYTFFSISGTQAHFIEVLSSTPYDNRLKIPCPSGEEGSLGYIDRILITLCDIVKKGSEEISDFNNVQFLSLMSSELNCIYDIFTGTFFNM